jgi:hypothetical protein
MARSDLGVLPVTYNFKMCFDIILLASKVSRRSDAAKTVKQKT